jgi:hypothetical protein
MIDINTILTQALTAAVAEATAPLQQRIAALEAQLAAQATPAPQVADAAAAMDALNSQEWFWEKVRRFADAAAEAHVEAHLENASHLDEDDVNSLVEQGVEYHEENRTHGDEDDIEEMVQKLLNGATISISV